MKNYLKINDRFYNLSLIKKIEFKIYKDNIYNKKLFYVDIDDELIEIETFEKFEKIKKDFLEKINY